VSAISRILLLCLGIFAPLCAQSIWSDPDFSPYPNVAPNGSYLRVLAIPEISIGGTDHVNIYFSSNLVMSPGLLGNGWRLPLFEATCYKNSETNCSAELPNGRKVAFIRGKDGIFRSDGDLWQGGIKGNQFRIRSKNGEELLYENGRLVGFTTLGESYSIGRDANSRWLLQGSKTLLRLENLDNAKEGSVTLFGPDNRKMAEFAKSSQLQQLPRLSELESITTKNGTQKMELIFGEDKVPNGLMFEGRKSEWDNSKGGRLKSDGTFLYTIKQANESVLDISCKNTQTNHTNSLYIDMAKGVQITTDGDLSEERYIFLAGPTSGNIKKIIKRINGAISSEVYFFYDSVGNFLAKKSNDHTYFFAGGQMEEK